MVKLALVLSLLAAGFSGYAVWGTQEAAKDFRVQVNENLALRNRIVELEAAAAAHAPVAGPLAVDAPAGTPGPALIPAASLSSRPAPTLTDLDRRLAELEKKEKDASEQLARLRGVGPDGQPLAAQTAEPGTSVNMPEIYNTVEDAEKHLALSPAQKAEFQRTVEEAQRDIEQLKKTPADDGTTWADAEKEVFKMDGNSFSFDGTKMQAFREKVIPGRNESFGAAERRISDGAKKRLRDTLTPEQQGKFDKAMMPSLVGGGGGAFGGLGSIIFSTTPDVVETAPAPEPGMEK